MSKRWRWILVTGLVLSAGSASSFWWNTDMFDQPSLKPQEGTPRALPQGAEPRNVRRYPTHLTREQLVELLKQELGGTTSPRPQDAQAVARGRALFQTFCAACHGPEGNADGPVAKKGVMPWWPLSAPQTQMKSDVELFAQIWVGGPVMGPYWMSLEEDEAWDLVAFIRSLNQSQGQGN